MPPSLLSQSESRCSADTAITPSGVVVLKVTTNVCLAHRAVLVTPCRCDAPRAPHQIRMVQAHMPEGNHNVVPLRRNILCVALP